MNQIQLTILDWLLSQGSSIDPDPIPSLGDWKKRCEQSDKNWSEPIDRAIAGGFLADRTAYAFAAGYHAALQRLVPSLPPGSITAFCVTEKGGGHPRAILSRLERIDGEPNQPPLWKLNGFKSFVTCAREAEVLLVAASIGTGEDGRNRVRMVQLKRDTPGLTINPMKDLPYIPEISHGTVSLEEVEIADAQLLPGDGYSEYVKPFRTIEDLYILAAVTGYQFRAACEFGWPRELKEQLLASLACIRTLAVADPNAAQVHIALAGLRKQMNLLAVDLDPLWKETPETTKNAWERDKGLTNISVKAQSQRLETAWENYGD
ncbi:MAG: acyl-CoA dehydrogenase [Proteobacteria bacterium]|nr:acyl-CoA dehydrogenase [Pseudomonadota bacterium]